MVQVNVLRRVGGSYYFDSPSDAGFEGVTADPPGYLQNKVPQIDPIDARLVFEPDANGGFTIGVCVTPTT